MKNGTKKRSEKPADQGGSKEEDVGVLIDLRTELQLRHLARMLVEDLGLDVHDLEGEPIDFAKDLVARVDALPEGHGESIEEDHPELFRLLRERKANG